MITRERNTAWWIAVMTGLLFVEGGSGCGVSSTAPAKAGAGVGAPAAAPAKATTAREGSELLDHSAPDWTVGQWFNSPPLELSQLRGQVVFVRWFMDPSCPFCSGTAPELRALDEHYRSRGLVVVGMYHHKAATPLDPADVRGWVDHYGYRFPVAIDVDWKTLKRWWLDGAHPERDYTSVSFLLDRRGVVRYIHPGGLIDPKSADARAIDEKVEALLAEAP